MSDSDFSDVDDALPEAPPSLMSSVTFRAIRIDQRHGDFYVRLGGRLYPWQKVEPDVVTVVRRTGSSSKPTAADSRYEQHLEFTSNHVSPSDQERILIDVLKEDEPQDKPAERSSVDGSLAIRVVWGVGEKTAHSKFAAALAPPSQSLVAKEVLPPPPPVLSSSRDKEAPLSLAELTAPSPHKSGEYFLTPNGTLTVHVKGGEALLDRDLVGHSDPFVMVFKDKEKILSTPVVSNTLSPEWQEGPQTVFTFSWGPSGGTTNPIFTFQVWDEDATSNDFLGEAVITAAEMATFAAGYPGGEAIKRLVLCPRANEDDDVVRKSRLGILSLKVRVTPVPQLSSAVAPAAPPVAPAPSMFVGATAALPTTSIEPPVVPQVVPAPAPASLAPQVVASPAALVPHPPKKLAAVRDPPHKATPSVEAHTSAAPLPPADQLVAPPEPPKANSIVASPPAATSTGQMAPPVCFLHCEVVCTENLGQKVPPTCYCEVTFGKSTDPFAVSLRTRAVKRCQDPYFRDSLAAPYGITFDQIRSCADIVCSIRVMEKRLIGDKAIFERDVKVSLSTFVRVSADDPSAIVFVPPATPASDLFDASGELFQGIVSNVQTLRIPLGDAADGKTTTVVMKVAATSFSSPALAEFISPLAAVPLVPERVDDGASILQYEIVKASLRSEDAPIGSYLAQCTTRSNLAVGNNVISVDRTLTVLAEKSTPLWLQSFQIDNLSTRAVVLDLSVVRSITTERRETPIGVARLQVPFLRSSEWREVTLDLILPPDTDGALAKQEKQNDCGKLFVKYRTVCKAALEEEIVTKKQGYGALLNAPQQLPSTGSNHDYAPYQMFQYNLSFEIDHTNDLLLCSAKDKFSDSCIMVGHSGTKVEVSNTVSLADATLENSRNYTTQHRLRFSMVPSYRAQQFVLTHCVPVAGGGTKGGPKCLGQGILDLSLPDLVLGVPHVFCVPLGPRGDVTDKERAEDISLLNRSNRENFGSVFVSVRLDRFEFWSNESILRITELAIHRLPVSMPPSSFPRQGGVVALWFRRRLDFAIETSSIKLVSLNEKGAFDEAVQLSYTPPTIESEEMSTDPNTGATTVVVHSKSSLNPKNLRLCVALLSGTTESAGAQLEDLQKCLFRFQQAAEGKVSTAQGLSLNASTMSTPAGMCQVVEEVNAIASREIAMHVENYIELNISSSLLEAGAMRCPGSLTTFDATSLVVRGSARMNASEVLALAAEWSLISQDTIVAIAADVIPSSDRSMKVMSERLWTAHVEATLPLAPNVPISKQLAAIPVSLTFKPSVLQAKDASRLPPEESCDFVITAPVQELEDALATSTKSLLVRSVAIVFGSAYASRTEVNVRAIGSKPIVIQLDALHRAERHVTVPSYDETRPPLRVSYMHGLLGLSPDDVRKQRRDEEEQWRKSQTDPMIPAKLFVPFVTKQEDGFAPPRISGATLTRCSGNIAVLVGGMDEVSRPLSSIFRFSAKEKKWIEMLPAELIAEYVKKVESTTGRLMSASEKLSQSLYRQTVDAHRRGAVEANVSGNGSSSIFSARHGHTSAYCSVSNQLIIYGGIGPGGFDPAQVGEEGYFISKPSQKRNGYLDDVWALDPHQQTLKKLATSMAAGPATQTSSDDVQATVHSPSNGLLQDVVHEYRWRHTAVCHKGVMYVCGGKTVFVRSVTYGHNKKQSKADAHYSAVEELCSCQYLSALDIRTQQWKLVVTTGDIPSPRYGHGVVCSGGKMYLFGGRSATSLRNDLYCLDLDTLEWEEVLPLGPVAPPPLELFSIDIAIVDDVETIVVVGGRGSSFAVSAAKDKLQVHMFVIESGFWRTVSSQCAVGPRRLMPAMCNVTVTKKKAANRNLARLPFATAPLCQLLLVGGERGVPLRDGIESLSATDAAPLVSEEEALFFDASVIRCRPAGQNVILNLARDTEDTVQLSVGAQLRQAQVQDAVISEQMIETHLSLKSYAMPGWAVEKMADRLSRRPASRNEDTTRVDKQKKGPKFSDSDTQEKSMQRMSEMVMKARQQAQQERAEQEANEAKRMANKNVSQDVKQWDQDKWNHHFQRLVYDPAAKYKEARDPNRLPDDATPPQSARKISTAEELKRVNEQLFYKAVKSRQESMVKLVDDTLGTQRPQSASIPRARIEDAINRLHRGPPSPLSSEKFGPKGKGLSSATATTKRREGKK